jgi:rhamnogalacturonyl hydrolase YesR
MKQFDITWRYLWNEDAGLLYHAFSATPTASTSSAAWGETGVYHSKEFWGRAEGWYIFALVDILEQMQMAGLTASADYATLRGYLNKMAAGLVAKQDPQTGCWYQLLNHDGSFSADTYKGKKYSAVSNYIESSATAIFIAAFLKGQRLGLYDADYTAAAKKAYRGFVENFITDDGNGGVHLIGSCRSAGLCGSNNRDGSAAYYLLGPDVSVVTAKDKQTEGKVLGAFIMAAVEYERLADATGIAQVNYKAYMDNKENTRKVLSHNAVVITTPEGTYGANGETGIR